MATSNVDVCDICTEAFNAVRRQSVALPCGHDFCVSCLVRLKASGKCQCPTCRRSWAGFEVPTLPGMEALAAALQENQDDDGEVLKKKGMFNRCEKHSMDYLYWAKNIKEFYCARCVAENPPTKLELIEDVIPQIKAAIALDVPNAKKKVENFLRSLDEMHDGLVSNRKKVKEFMKAVQTLDDNFEQEIEEIECVKSNALDTASELNKIERKLSSCETPADVNVAVDCSSTLKKVAAQSSVPTSDLAQTLLCTIASSYVEGAATASLPPSASWLNAVLKGNREPLLKMVRAVEQLKGGQDWTVDNRNSEAALLMLADRQPSCLSLVARDDAREALPVVALARAASAEVQATFVDTFYSATDTSKDAERLDHLTLNQSLRLSLFIGHLDHLAITKLPDTINTLGLAIGSAADAAAVSGLRPWGGLTDLHVSVSSRVAAEDLKPLPCVADRWLYFPFLSDAGVDRVRPAIEALVPDLKKHRNRYNNDDRLEIHGLLFPKSQLTAAGARRLTQRLRGVRAISGVTNEASGTWRPGKDEEESVAAELKSATGCAAVFWNMDWIYL